MWSNLKKLLTSGLGRPTRRRKSLPRFRGQFEPLETRNVLSATIGVMAVDFEAQTITIAVWDIQPPTNSFAPHANFGDAPWETHSSRGLDNAPWRPGEAPLRILGGGLGNALNGSRGEILGGISERLPSNSGGAQVDKPPQMAQAPGNTDSGTGSLGLPIDAGATNGFVTSSYGGMRVLRTLANAALYYSWNQDNPSTSTEPASTQPKLAVSDAAFDSYSPDSLLLATSDDLRDEATPAKLDDDADSLDEGDEPQGDDSFATEEVAASLDALRRERAAIDEVLADLHEVQLCESQQLQPAGETAQFHHDDQRAPDEEFFYTDERAAPDRTDHVPNTGGMVLLQPTGDANSSAYDLTNAFFATLGNDEAPLAVETSLGMFHAVDVGASQRPTAASAELPVAQPAAQALRPSVSAENAPAKKSEQPT